MELNPNMQYILCGDISASMQTIDPKCGGKDRFNYMLEKFKSFIKESEDFDPDGPTIILFGENTHVYENTTLENINHKFENIKFEGFTNTHLLINECYKLHVKNKHERTCVLLFTDGEPTNYKQLERNIEQIANNISKEDEFNISFILVGTIEDTLKKYLEKLDNNLNAKFDIVGVTEVENLTFIKAVNNAINE